MTSRKQVDLRDPTAIAALDRLERLWHARDGHKPNKGLGALLLRELERERADVERIEAAVGRTAKGGR